MTERVNAHWRLETEQGHPNHPPHLQTESLPPPLRSVVGSLPSTATRRKLRVGYELGLFYFGGRGCEASASGRITRGSLALSLPPLSPFFLFFSCPTVSERFIAGFAPRLRTGLFLATSSAEEWLFSRRSRIEKPPLLCAVGSRILWINAPEDRRAPLFHRENCDRLSA